MDALPDGPAEGRTAPNLLGLPLRVGSAFRAERYLLDSKIFQNSRPEVEFWDGIFGRESHFRLAIAAGCPPRSMM
jgi:hypothetical protein